MQTETEEATTKEAAEEDTTNIAVMEYEMEEETPAEAIEYYYHIQEESDVAVEETGVVIKRPEEIEEATPQQQQHLVIKRPGDEDGVEYVSVEDFVGSGSAATAGDLVDCGDGVTYTYYPLATEAATAAAVAPTEEEDDTSVAATATYLIDPSVLMADDNVVMSQVQHLQREQHEGEEEAAVQYTTYVYQDICQEADTAAGGQEDEVAIHME